MAACIEAAVWCSSVQCLVWLFLCVVWIPNIFLLSEQYLQLAGSFKESLMEWRTCYSWVALLIQHSSWYSKDPGLSVDYHPGEQEEAMACIFFTYARSLTDKLDEPQPATNKIIWDSFILLITETWLHSLITNETIELVGYTAYWHDKIKSSNKSKGGGLCIYINSSVTISKVIASHCWLDLTVKCMHISPKGVYSHTANCCV